MVQPSLEPGAGSSPEGTHRERRHLELILAGIAAAGGLVAAGLGTWATFRSADLEQDTVRRAEKLSAYTEFIRDAQAIYAEIQAGARCGDASPWPAPREDLSDLVTSFRTSLARVQLLGAEDRVVSAAQDVNTGVELSMIRYQVTTGESVIDGLIQDNIVDRCVEYAIVVQEETVPLKVQIGTFTIRARSELEHG